MKSRFPALCILTAISHAACFSIDDPSGNSPAPPADTTPPSIPIILVPDWPPLGPDGTVRVEVRDNASLSRLTATFRNVERRVLRGTQTEITLTGRELGEGMGLLSLVACDQSNGCAERNVKNLVVDMTPPDVVMERAVVSPRLEELERQIGVWASDAWVLGSVSLEFMGTTLTHELPKAYPATLGKSWDVTRVGFDSRRLPEGKGDATLTVRDAAGNVASRVFPLHVDATLPTVAIQAPVNGATVKDAFDVRFVANDNADDPPVVELWVGGSRIFEAPAIFGKVRIDAASLSRGATEICAMARDPAGNRSDPACIKVQVSTPNL
jgi:hypothetical protein